LCPVCAAVAETAGLTMTKPDFDLIHPGAGLRLAAIHSADRAAPWEERF